MPTSDFDHLNESNTPAPASTPTNDAAAARRPSTEAAYVAPHAAAPLAMSAFSDALQDSITESPLPHLPPEAPSNGLAIEIDLEHTTPSDDLTGAMDLAQAFLS